MKSATARQLDIPPTNEEMDRADELRLLLRDVIHGDGVETEGIDIARLFAEFSELNGLLSLWNTFLMDHRAHRAA